MQQDNEDIEIIENDIKYSSNFLLSFPCNPPTMQEILNEELCNQPQKWSHHSCNPDLEGNCNSLDDCPILRSFPSQIMNLMLVSDAAISFGPICHFIHLKESRQFLLHQIYQKEKEVEFIQFNTPILRKNDETRPFKHLKTIGNMQ